MAHVLPITVSVADLILRESYNPKQTIAVGDPNWDAHLALKAKFGYELGQVVVNPSKEVLLGAEHVVAAKAQGIASLSVLQVAADDELAIAMYGFGIKDETVLDRLAVLRVILADGSYKNYEGTNTNEKIACYIKAHMGVRENFSARSIGKIMPMLKKTPEQLEMIKGITKDAAASKALKVLGGKRTRTRTKTPEDIARLATRLTEHFNEGHQHLDPKNALVIAKMCMAKACPVADARQRMHWDLLCAMIDQDQVAFDGLLDAAKALVAKLEAAIQAGEVTSEPVVIEEIAA
jgi:hypothetical protein